MLYILLKNVRFRAYHGLYPEERQKGNDFEVNMKVGFRPDTDMINRISETIDYSELIAIIDTLMKTPVSLLETLVLKLKDKVTTHYPQIETLWVSVEKINPPIDGFTGSTAVEYNWDKTMG